MDGFALSWLFCNESILLKKEHQNDRRKHNYHRLSGSGNDFV